MGLSLLSHPPLVRLLSIFFFKNDPQQIKNGIAAPREGGRKVRYDPLGVGYFAASNKVPCDVHIPVILKVKSKRWLVVRSRNLSTPPTSEDGDDIQLF